MSNQRYSKEYRVPVKRYEDVRNFIEGLREEGNRVLAYSVAYQEMQAVITVLFAENKGQNKGRKSQKVSSAKKV